MNPVFLRHLRIVAAVHIGLLLVLAAFSGLRALFRKKPETMLPVEFVVERPAAPEPSPRVPEAPEREPELPAPAPQPKPKPRRRPIERSTKKIVRPADAAKPKPTLSEEEIKRLLARGARLSDHTNIPNDDAQCYERIRQVLYRAWIQPSADEVGNPEAEAAIELRQDGRITARRIARGSGNEVMDASVLRALQAVTHITGLSQSFLARHREVTILFRLE